MGIIAVLNKIRISHFAQEIDVLRQDSVITISLQQLHSIWCCWVKDSLCQYIKKKQHCITSNSYHHQMQMKYDALALDGEGAEWKRETPFPLAWTPPYAWCVTKWMKQILCMWHIKSASLVRRQYWMTLSAWIMGTMKCFHGITRHVQKDPPGFSSSLHHV